MVAAAGFATPALGPVEGKRLMQEPLEQGQHLTPLGQSGGFAIFTLARKSASV